MAPNWTDDRSRIAATRASIRPSVRQAATTPARILTQRFGRLTDGRHQSRSRHRQAEPGRLRGLHPGAAPGQERRQPQCRARALAAPHPAEGSHRHRADGRSFQARPRQAADRPRRRRSTGSARTKPRCRGSPTPSIDVLDRGWHYATLFFGETQIRTGHLLVGGAQVARAAARADRPSRANSARSTSTRSPTSIARSGRTPRKKTCVRWTARACVAAGTPGAEAAAGPARHDRARPVLAGPHRQGRRPARWTRSSAATRRSARSSTC